MKCAFSLGHINLKPPLRYCACYRNQSYLGDMLTDLPSEVINNENFKTLRKQLVNNQFPEGCMSCKQFEDNSNISTRKKGLLLYEGSLETDYNQLLKNYNPETGAISIENIKSIELRFSNVCNLQCRHCNPLYSSQWEQFAKKHSGIANIDAFNNKKSQLKDTPVEVYEDILNNFVPHLKLIMIAGGEPMFHPYHYEFLDKIPKKYAKNIVLTYSSNLTLLKIKQKELLHVWSKFKQINVTISADGTGKLYNYFRHKGDWSILKSNIELFKEWQNILPLAGYITCTASAYQMFYLPQIVNEFYELIPSLHSSIVQYPEIMNSRIIHNDIKKLIKRDWEDYLQTIENSHKLKQAKKLGDELIKYMMCDHDQNLTWQDFVQYVKKADKLLGKNCQDYCPEIYKWFDYGT